LHAGCFTSNISSINGSCDPATSQMLLGAQQLLIDPTQVEALQQPQ
jgi:hypothetical protein